MTQHQKAQIIQFKHGKGPTIFCCVGDFAYFAVVGEIEEGKVGYMGMEADLTWGGEHTIQYTYKDDVL